MFKITAEPITAQMVIDAVSTNSAGAVATFLGTVRDNSLGREVLFLEYEAYPEMAEKMMQKVADEIYDRWKTDRIAIIHRTGRLKLGEVSVAIAVATPHRKTAFEACEYAIERLKQIVPIWKREVWKGGEEWVESIGTSKVLSTSKADSRDDRVR